MSNYFQYVIESQMDYKPFGFLKIDTSAIELVS